MNSFTLVLAVVPEFPEVKDRSSMNEGVQMPALSLQNGQTDFIPDELLSSLTSTICPQDRPQYNKSHKHPKACQNTIIVSVFHVCYKWAWTSSIALVLFAQMNLWSYFYFLMQVYGIRASDAVWHHSAGRRKYHYFLNQPTSMTGAGRLIFSTQHYYQLKQYAVLLLFTILWTVLLCEQGYILSVWRFGSSEAANLPPTHAWQGHRFFGG